MKTIPIRKLQIKSNSDRIICFTAANSKNDIPRKTRLKIDIGYSSKTIFEGTDYRNI